MKYYKKQKIGENLLYVMVWLAILLVPILNSKMMSEVHVSLSNILIAWQQIAPYLFIFIIHNAFIVRYVKRHQYMRYVVVDVLFISAVFYGVDILDSILGDFATPEHLISAKHASFTDLPVYWNIVLGLFMTCANTAIKMMYQSLRDEQAMEELKRQNLQAEMDYQPPFLHEHAQQHPLADRHRRRLCAGRRDRAVEDDALRPLRIGARGHYAREGHPVHGELHQTDAHPLHRRRGYPVRLPERPAARRHHTAAAADRLRRKRPSFIHIRVRYIDGKVYYSIINSRHTAEPSGKDAGIGLENVRRRLQLIFANRHTLAIDTRRPNMYRVKLIIPATSHD